MFCLYSKGCEYAIRALAEISAEKIGNKVLARDICRKADIPEAYARKTFQVLVRNGFLKAVSGPGGGYSLARDPEKATVLDVIEAVEGQKSFSKCILGLSTCGYQAPCALHPMWVEAKGQMIESLSSCTLLSLALSTAKSKGKVTKRKRL